VSVAACIAIAFGVVFLAFFAIGEVYVYRRDRRLRREREEITARWIAEHGAPPRPKNPLPPDYGL
jgi:hypothetical protein